MRVLRLFKFVAFNRIIFVKVSFFSALLAELQNLLTEKRDNIHPIFRDNFVLIRYHCFAIAKYFSGLSFPMKPYKNENNAQNNTSHNQRGQNIQESIFTGINLRCFLMIACVLKRHIHLVIYEN